MRIKHSLLTMAAVAAALVVGLPSKAASDCLSLQLTPPASLCAGQPAAITASVTNSCSSRMLVTASFNLDGQTLPVTVGFAVAGDSTRTKSFPISIPGSASNSSHVLTVTLTDSAGGSTSATVDLSVSTCAGPTSGSGLTGGDRIRPLH